MTTARTQLVGQIQEPGLRPRDATFVVNAATQYVLRGYLIDSYSPEISSGALDLDFNVAGAFEVTLDANVTSITISNPPVEGYGEIIVKFIQDGTGSRTVGGWPAAVKWPGGTAPTITTTATTGTDLIALKTFDSGTTWYGDFSQDYQ